MDDTREVSAHPLRPGVVEVERPLAVPEEG